MAANRFKFVQTGDIHVGRWKQSKGQGFALDRAAAIFDAVHATACEHSVDAVLVLGDIFDSPMPTAPERELVTRKLALYAGAMGRPWYVIDGNHDLITTRSSATDYLAELGSEVKNLHVAFAREPSYWEVNPKLTIIGAPSAFSERQDWVEDTVASLPLDRRYIFMGHGIVAPAQGKRTLSLARASQNNVIAYWSYGDRHDRCRIPTLAPDAKGFYAGAPVPMRFGEGPDMGCLVVALDEGEDGFAYKGKKYIRLDEPFAPLVEVTDDTDLSTVPTNAIIKKPPHILIGDEKQVASIRPAVARTVDISTPGWFDPIVSTPAEIEAAITVSLPTPSETALAILPKIVQAAVTKFRNRIYTASASE